MIFYTFLLAIIPLSLFSGQIQKAIYLDDDRKDFYEIENVLHQNLGESVVAILNSKRELKRNPEAKEITYKNSIYGINANLCDKSDRYYNQKTLSYCTGFLVSKDLILTAAHCLDSRMHDRINFVFGFNIKSPESLGETTFKRNDIYQIKEILVYRPKDPTTNLEYDLGLVRLDRDVVGRAPLKFSSSTPSIFSRMISMGHPFGVPLKYVEGEIIQNDESLSSFKVNLDFFSGNSGSPVINSETGLVEGVLVSGERDFKEDEKRCNYYVRCDENSNCSGENVIRAAALLPFIKKYLVD